MQGETIKSKAKENRQKFTQRLRENPKSRNIKKRTVRNRSLSRNFYANVNLFTTDYIKPISSLNKAYTFSNGIFSHNNDINKIVKDIYPIIDKFLPNVLELADLPKNITNIEFLDWMLRIYEYYLPHEDIIWTVDLDANKNYTIYHMYDMDDVGVNGRSAPICWLFKVKQYNYELYEIFIAFLHNMYKSIHCPMYYNCDHILQAIEFLPDEENDLRLNGDDEDVARADNIKTCINIYKNGDAKELESEIRCCTIGVENFESKLKNFKAKTPREKQLIKFLKKHKHLIYHEDTLHMFYHSGYITEGYEEESNNYFDLYAQILFSYDDEDAVYNWVVDMYESYANEYGVIPFRQIVDVSKDEKISDLPMLYVKMLDDLNALLPESS